MNRVIRQGVKTKVLMLSATPVNNRFNDLKNQLQLAYEGKVENINEELDMDHSIDDVFRNAQTVYNRWAKLDVKERTTERLLNELSFDFSNCWTHPVPRLLFYRRCPENQYLRKVQAVTGLGGR